MTHKDYAGNEIKLGDFLTWASGYKGCRLGLGRVIRLTPKQCIVMEANPDDIRPPSKWVGNKWVTPDIVKTGKWTYSECRVLHIDRSLVITNAQLTLPQVVFEHLDALEITGKREKKK